MMKLFLPFIPILICLVGCSATGGDFGTEEFSPLAEFPPVPLKERKATPLLDKTFSAPSRGRLTLVYTAPAGVNGKDIWLLLFERQLSPKSRLLNTRFEGYVGSHGPVTLLVVEPNASSQKKRWSIINSISLGYVNKLRKNYITLRWLEPAQQKGPVVIVNKLGGVGGSSELLAFPTGWNQPDPVRQTYQDWMRWDDGAKYHFQLVDHNGFLCVTETHSDYTHDPPQEKTSTRLHVWNGAGWN